MRETTELKDLAAIQMLKFIEDWVEAQRTVHAGREAHMLWHILAGMRGPDDGDIEAKKEFTQVLRSAVLPKLAIAGGGTIARDWTTEEPRVVGDEELHELEIKARGRVDATPDIVHFFSHAQIAAQYIRLGREREEARERRKLAGLPQQQEGA